MKRVIGAAVAAFALLCASSMASAAVVYQDTGTTTRLDIWMMPLPGAGTYEFAATSSLPIEFYFSVDYEHQYDTYYAPAPRPPGERSIDGNSVHHQDSNVGVGNTWTFVLSETTRRFFNSSSYHEIFGVPLGTPLYDEDRYVRPYFSVYAINLVDGERMPFDYNFTLTQVSAVPEPAAWAMMIIGFGTVGSMVRRRRVNHAYDRP